MMSLTQEQKQINVRRRLELNLDIISEMVARGEKVSIIPSRSGCKFLHGYESRYGFLGSDNGSTRNLLGGAVDE